MKRIIFLIILLLIIAGCGQKDVVSFDENSKLVIERQVGSESSVDYEVINEIEDEKTVQKVNDIFKGIKWQTNVDVEMPDPDYRLNRSYHIWITPKGDALEIVNTSNSNYGRLSESDTPRLFKIMTGKELESN